MKSNLYSLAYHIFSMLDKRKVRYKIFQDFSIWWSQNLNLGQSGFKSMIFLYSKPAFLGNNPQGIVLVNEAIHIASISP